MDRKRQKMSPEKNDVQNECQDAKITVLERKLEHMENKLKLVIAELEQVKEERARDKTDFETEKYKLESIIDKYKEQCTELQSENKKLQSENEILHSENEILHSEKEMLQSENEKLHSENEKLQSENKRLQKYFQDFVSGNINVEEKSQINLCNTDLNSQTTKINLTNDDALDINSLPNEIILNIFGYLEQNQLGQIARVCRRWNVLIKSPLLWKNVNVRFFPYHRSQITIAKSFINRLPSSVTSIRLHLTGYNSRIELFDFEELCLRLQEKCPHLEDLTLIDSTLSNSLSSVIGLCSQFLQNVKKLIFQDCVFLCRRSTDECFGISKIKILELLDCLFASYNECPFSKMPHLKQLHLYDTNVDISWFEDDASFLNQLHVLNLAYTLFDFRVFSAIQNHAHNLRELYPCSVDLTDEDLDFNNSIFPHLKTICLSDTLATCEGVVFLIQSCPSLENVYVNECVAESVTEHPFFVANRSKSGIVKTIDMEHKHNVDYLHT